MRFGEIVAALWLMAEDDADLRDFLIMFVAEQSLTNTLRVPNVVFDVQKLTVEESRHKMRFQPTEIMELAVLLDLPPIITTAQGVQIHRVEALCVVLQRLAYPCRWKSLMFEFGRHWTILCSLFGTTISLIYEHFGEKIKFDTAMFVDNQRSFANAVHEVSGCLNNCIGFVDGTLRPIPRPTRFQRQAYNGWKHLHAIKFQPISLPNGLIGSLWGPIEGRRHDVVLLRESGVGSKLRRYCPGFCIYGDPAYPLSSWLVRPIKKVILSPREVAFNKAMSRVRVTVEWGFGDIITNWAFLDFKKNMKLFLSPVGKLYMVGCLLTNCMTCVRGGNKTSAFFDCAPPTLAEYLHN